MHTVLTIAILAFREFFEAFLIVSVFFGVSKRFDLKQEKELLLATTSGLAISVLLPVIVFLLGPTFKSLTSHENAELFEAYMLTFSGFFIAYVVFSMHKFLEPKRNQVLKQVKEKLIQKEAFNVSLFLTIVFFIAREGFEIAVLSAATTVFSDFMSNIAGLFIGFVAAGIVGAGLYFSYLKIPVCKIFQYTEYTIILFGAAMVKNGLAELVEQYMHIKVADLLPINLAFLPSDETFVGHIVKQLFGFEQGYSLVMLGIMGIYIAGMYLLFLRPVKITAK